MVGTEPVRVLGFDPGLHLPAFAEMDMKGKLIRVQVVRDKKAIDSSIDPAWRAHYIASLALREVIAEKVPGTYVVGIEGPAYGYKNSNSMDQLARCRQALYDQCAQHLDDFVYYSIPPDSRLGAVGLMKKHQKDDVVAQVQRLYRVNLHQTNKLFRQAEADSVAIAAAAISAHKRSNLL